MPAVGAGGGPLDIFARAFHFSLPSSSLWVALDIDGNTV